MLPAPLPIDPLVDCVFKALLGDPANQDLLLHFLNAILRPEVPLVAVSILNPFNPGDFVGDKQTVVNVKATDSAGVVYQIEVQVLIEPALRERILYTWAHVYHGQITEGQPYTGLRPACSIWILEGALFREQPDHHHRFAVLDPHTRLLLSPQLDIHVIELRKLRPFAEAAAAPLDDEARWLYFLKEGRRWASLPQALRSPEMMKAMSVLDCFADAARDRALYQSRSDFLHLQRTRQVVDEENARRMAEAEARLAERSAKVTELEAALERERAEKVEAEERAQRLRRALIDAGLDPDALPG